MASLSRASFLAQFDEHLSELDRQSRLRRLSPKVGFDFTSNDYLGLANSAELKAAIVDALSRGVPVGSGGSRLLRGNDAEHELLEEEAATFFGSDAALYFSSGYAANSALLSTLPQRGDIIIHDELIHASSHEGMRMSRASSRAAIHNDVQSFADAIRSFRAAGETGRVWLVVESLYSMDGDKAPLGELLSLALAKECFLVIDEAHATGVFGTHGRGLSEGFENQDNVITVRTCGKALGCEGALICCPQPIKDFLINRGRGFIFSTAPSPLMAAGVRTALKVLEQQPERRNRLRVLIDFAAQCLGPLGASCHDSQILPLIIGDSAQTMQIAARLQMAGFDVRGIRPPTVPDGTSRLRISITLNTDVTMIAALAQAVADLRQ